MAELNCTSAVEREAFWIYLCFKSIAVVCFYWFSLSMPGTVEWHSVVSSWLHQWAIYHLEMPCMSPFRGCETGEAPGQLSDRHCVARLSPPSLTPRGTADSETDAHRRIGRQRDRDVTHPPAG